MELWVRESTEDNLAAKTGGHTTAGLYHGEQKYHLSSANNKPEKWFSR